MAPGFFVRSPRRFEKGDEVGQVIGSKMPQLARVAGAHLFIEAGQQLAALFGQADQHHPAIIGRSLPLDQAALFEFVEQPRNVRRPRYQPGR